MSVSNVASDWPRTFLRPRCLCLALSLYHNCGYIYSVCTYTYQLYTTDPVSPTITRTTPLSSTSFTVNWTITDPNRNYIITWTNLCTGIMEGSMTVPENTTSYNVTGLTGTDNYNVSVSANNSCGIMMSDPITVYGKNVHY